MVSALSFCRSQPPASHRCWKYLWPTSWCTSNHSLSIRTMPRTKHTPKLPILTFSPSTAPHSFNPIPFSAAFWLPKGLSFVTPRLLIRCIRTSRQPLTSGPSIRSLFPSHLFPTHFPPLPAWAYCPARSRDPLPSFTLDPVLPLTLVHPLSTLDCFPLPSLFPWCPLFTSDSSFLLRFLVSPCCINPTPLKLLPYLSSWPAWAYCPARLPYFFLPLFSLFISSPPSCLSIYFLPLLPPFSSASHFRPHCLSRCLPKVALPNVAAPFVATAQSRRLPPCRAPFAWCRLWSSAVFERRSYGLRTLWCHLCWWMPWITCCTFVSWHSPHHFRSRFYHHPTLLNALYSSLRYLFIFPTPPLHRRGELSGASLWHIVRLVLLRSSILSPLIYFNTPPQRPLPSTFFPTSPLTHPSYFKPHLVQLHSP